jgi:hypothetical protein
MMPDLGMRAIDASIQLSIQNNPAADSGPDGDI